MHDGVCFSTKKLYINLLTSRLIFFLYKCTHSNVIIARKTRIDQNQPKVVVFLVSASRDHQQQQFTGFHKVIFFLIFFLFISLSFRY